MSPQRNHASDGPAVRPHESTTDRLSASVITDPSELEQLCAEIRSVGRFAFDTEFVMEDRYTPQICLVQLATESHAFVVDPLALSDLSAIWSLVTDPRIETIVHAGTEDFALCYGSSGKPPANVFDCQIACGLISRDYPLSLSRMVRSFVHIRLPKSHTLTEWGRRPLTDGQIQYAAADVKYLPAIHQKLVARLQQRDRLSWLTEEMERFSRVETYQRDPDASAFKLRGAGGLDGRGLAIARELVKARDGLAETLNRPVRGVVRDHLLVEIAKHRWTRPEQIRKLRGLNLRTAHVRVLADAVVRANSLPIDQCPKAAPPCEESDEEAAVAMLISALIRARCAEEEIAHQLVASRQTVRDYVQAVFRDEDHQTSSSLRCGWRAVAVGRLIDDVLGGKRAVQVSQTVAGRTLTTRNT